MDVPVLVLTHQVAGVEPSPVENLDVRVGTVQYPVMTVGPR